MGRLGGFEVIVLDTHVWIWFVSDPAQISPQANETIESAMNKNEILISSISTWEIALLVQKNRLKLTTDVVDWVSHSEKLPFISFLPIDNSIALKSAHLPQPFHEDPADPFIVATAREERATILTKDPRILEYRHVRSLW